MRIGGVSDGILPTAHGITGDARRLSAARRLALANAEERRIMVVDLDGIERLTSRQDLRDLLIDSQLGLVTRS